MANVMLSGDDDSDAVILKLLSCTITGMKVRLWVRRLIRNSTEDIFGLMLKRLRSLDHYQHDHHSKYVMNKGYVTTYRPAINQMAPQSIFAGVSIGRICK